MRSESLRAFDTNGGLIVFGIIVVFVPWAVESILVLFSA